MPVNGKQKGGGFERDICKALSLWVSHGKNVDLFWRSAMSGGRATVAKGTVRQAGDITAVALEGHILTDQFYVECKFLKNISLDSLLKLNGPLFEIWAKTVLEAAKYNRIPTLIFKQNHYPTVFCTTPAGAELLQLSLPRSIRFMNMNIMRFDDVILHKFPLK